MSSYSSRPNVKQVDRVLVDAAIGGTSLIGSLIFGGVKALAKLAANNFHMPDSSVVVPAVAAVTDLPAQTLRLPTNCSKVDRERLEALNQLAQQPLRVSDTSSIAKHLNSVINSKSQAQLSSSLRGLRQAAVLQNDALFVSGIARTCEIAMRRIGIEDVSTSLSSIGTLRVVGTDARGRSLVSEITSKPGSCPTLETETVNVLDGSCTDMLDRFENALEKLGLRSSDPRRKVTSGLCETSAGKALIRSKFAKRFHKPIGQADGRPATQAVQMRDKAISGGGRK